MPQKGYQAGFPYTGGAGSGRGKYVDPSGAVYEGEFMDDNGYLHASRKWGRTSRIPGRPSPFPTGSEL